MTADRRHHYRASVHWEAGDAPDTTRYERYPRAFRVAIEGKPALPGSADPAFRGDPARHNPEDLFVASIASCHMLSYLALCSRHGVRVLAYADDAHGRMVTSPDGGGRFEEVELRPEVTIADDADPDLARELHRRAHETCFIASSCNFPIACRPSITRASPHSAHEVEAARPPTRKDLAIRLPDRPGALAELGEALGRAGVSIEGGGGFSIGGGEAIVHFLVEDDAAAVASLREAGIEVLGVRDVLVQRLDQDRPGQMGLFARAMAEAGVNIECVYSDHDHQLIACVDDLEAGAHVSRRWERGRA
jgi:organic hydroperoxide reductase OsmC/OhrA